MKRLALVGLMVVTSTASAGDNVLHCEDGDVYLDQLAPVWWDVDQPGMGVTLIPRDGGLWGYWTFYDRDGKASWYLLVSDTVGCTTKLKVYEYTGSPITNMWYDPELLDSSQILGGTHQLRISDQNHINFIFGYDGFSFAGTRFLDLTPF